MGDQNGAFLKKGDDDDERAWHRGHAAPLLPSRARRTGRRVVSHRSADRQLPVWQRACCPQRSRVVRHPLSGGSSRPVPSAGRGARAGSALPRVAQVHLSRTTASGRLLACQHGCPPLNTRYTRPGRLVHSQGVALAEKATSDADCSLPALQRTCPPSGVSRRRLSSRRPGASTTASWTRGSASRCGALRGKSTPCSMSTSPVAVADAPRGARTQVITKLLYLANQGDSFTKVRLLVAGRTRKCAPC